MTKDRDHIIDDKKVYDDGWLGVSKVKAELDGEIVTRSIIEHPPAAVVLAYDPSRAVAAIIRQTRLPVLRSGAERLREPVAGITEDQEHPYQTAIRECLEEAGIKLAHLEHVAQVWPDPSSSTELDHIFVAAYSRADRVNSGGGAEDEGEDIDVREERLSDLWGALERGEPMYGSFVICLQALRLRHPELFRKINDEA
jgi:nudix-type nucleoside diphosphatase (YffH/AdpP family)